MVDQTELFVLNKICLGQREVGWELFHKGGGGEILGYTGKQLKDVIKAGQVVYGMKLNGEELELDASKGFKAIMVKVGAGSLSSSDTSAIANLMYTVYERDGDAFQVVSSRFGHLQFSKEKILALMELGVVNGIVLREGELIPCWELVGSEEKKVPQPAKK